MRLDFSFQSMYRHSTVLFTNATLDYKTFWKEHMPTYIQRLQNMPVNVNFQSMPIIRTKLNIGLSKR